MRLCIFLFLFCSGVSSSAATTLKTLEARLEKDPGQTKVREVIAKTYLKKKQYDKVIELLAPYSNEVSVPSVIRLADAYSAKQDYTNQIRTLQLYLQRDPNAYRPHYLLGVAFHNNKQIDEAVTALRKAIEIAPKYRPSYDALLEVMIEKKDQYEARTVLSQMVVQFGPLPELLNMQCKLYSEGAFLAEAEQSCKKALSRSKNIPENHIFLAQALFDQGRKQAAENVFKAAARQFPKSELVQFSTGEYYFNEKNYAPAARYLKAGVTLKPDSARSLLGLALSLFELKQLAEALPYFEKACKLDKSREAYKEFRSVVSKIRQNNTADFKIADEYEKKIALCQ